MIVFEREAELALQDTCAPGRIDQPARVQLNRRSLALVSDCVRAMVDSQVDVAHADAVDELNACLARPNAEKVLEYSTIDLVGGCREVLSHPDFLDGIDVAPTFGGKEPEAELLQLAAG